MKRKNIEYFCRCGKSIHPKRKLLGYNNCLQCGESAAQKAAIARSKSVMPMHKSNYMYVGGRDLREMKDNVKNLTGKSGT